MIQKGQGGGKCPPSCQLGLKANLIGNEETIQFPEKVQGNTELFKGGLFLIVQKSKTSKLSANLIVTLHKTILSTIFEKSKFQKY